MAIDDVYQLTVTARGPAGIMQNTYAFIRTAPAEPVNNDFSLLAEALRDVHKTQQATSVQYITWRARQVRGTQVTWPSGTDCNPVGGNLFEGTPAGVNVGGTNGEELPWQCAMVTTHKTATIGRRHRGRTYAFGFVEQAQQSGVWQSVVTTPVQTNWGTFYANYAVPAGSSGFRFGVWSFRTASGCVPGPNGKGHVRQDAPNPAQAFTPFTSFVLRTTVFTQRRRVAGVGL